MTTTPAPTGPTVRSIARTLALPGPEAARAGMAGHGRIDVHHHPMYEFWRAEIAAHSPGLGIPEPTWDPSDALALMDATGVQAAVLSMAAPGVHFGDDAAARDLARRVNEAHAEVVRTHPDRFGFFATLPVPDVDGSLEEYRYAREELGADGVLLLSNTNGTYLGDPALDPLMDELGATGAVVLVHPAQLPGPVAPGVPPFLADFLLDTVRAALSMTLHDVPARYPGLSVILSHGGGFLPYIPARLDHTMNVMGVDADRREQLRSFWFDTALTPSDYSMPSLLALADPGRIVYGSDFPYVTPEKIAGFAERLDAYPLDAELREAIDHGNAEQVLPGLAARIHRSEESGA